MLQKVLLAFGFSSQNYYETTKLNIIPSRLQNESLGPIFCLLQWLFCTKHARKCDRKAILHLNRQNRTQNNVKNFLSNACLSLFSNHDSWTKCFKWFSLSIRSFAVRLLNKTKIDSNKANLLAFIINTSDSYLNTYWTCKDFLTSLTSWRNMSWGGCVSGVGDWLTGVNGFDITFIWYSLREFNSLRLHRYKSRFFWMTKSWFFIFVSDSERRGCTRDREVTSDSTLCDRSICFSYTWSYLNLMLVRLDKISSFSWQHRLKSKTWASFSCWIITRHLSRASTARHCLSKYSLRNTSVVSKVCLNSDSEVTGLVVNEGSDVLGLRITRICSGRWAFGERERVNVTLSRHKTDHQVTHLGFRIYSFTSNRINKLALGHDKGFKRIELWLKTRTDKVNDRHEN